MTWKSLQREKRGWLLKGPQHNAHRGPQLKAKRVRDQWEVQGHWCSNEQGYLLLFFFNFIYLTSQYCIGFAIYQNESAPGIHVFPILNPPPSSLPIPFLWVVPVHQPQASSIVHRTWTGNLFHIWYYTCFNAILPNHPTLSLSHRVQKTVLYIHQCLFCCLVYRVIVTIFLNSIYMC